MKLIPHFTQIENVICDYMKSADEVFICVAWISSIKIIDMASMLNSHLLIAQQSKFISGSYDYNRELFQQLKKSFSQVYMYTQGVDHIMHNKFMILCRDSSPYAVITGSYNYTIQAKKNCENIIYIENSQVASAYKNEFERLLEKCTPLT